MSRKTYWAHNTSALHLLIAHTVLNPCSKLACIPLSLAALCSICGGQDKQTQTIVFTDVTANSGIDFQHTDGSDGRHFLIESMSGGLALFDFDNDGDTDIYLLNGAPIDAPERPKKSNALYRNDGNMHFTDVTPFAGVGDAHFGLGVAVADYNNDGHCDLYINNYGPNVLYLNKGDGTFENVTAYSGTQNGNQVGGGVSFVDVDGDGSLDLYVANYISFDAQKHKVHIHKGLPSYPSPLSFQPAADALLRSNGDGTFEDISLSSGIASVAGRSMGVATLDVDGDFDTDIFVANDSQENYLFLNDGHGRFEELALLSGLTHDFRGRAQASMGVEVADFENDGLPDLVVTSFAEEFVTIYNNAGNGVFDDVSVSRRIGPATFPHVTWGLAAEDFDGDGWTDLFIGAGDLDDNRMQRGGNIQASGYKVEDLVFRNSGGGQMSFLEKRWGDAALVKTTTRGVVAGDLDQDGDLDIVTLNSRDQPRVYRNDSMQAGSSLRVLLVGKTSNRDGIGAQISLKSDAAATYVRSGRGYQSDVRAPVGLTDRTPAPPQLRLQITWPNGQNREVAVPPNVAFLTVTQK